MQYVLELCKHSCGVTVTGSTDTRYFLKATKLFSVVSDYDSDSNSFASENQPLAKQLQGDALLKAVALKLVNHGRVKIKPEVNLSNLKHSDIIQK